jgi:Bacterial Ig-like domain (group 3)/Bacterial Ig-like domain (group 2)
VSRIICRAFVLVLTWIAFTGLVLGKSSSSVVLSSSSNPSTYGNSVIFTATVTPSAATGTVTFKDGSATLGTGTLSSGKTTFSISTLAAGSHSITASYGGDTNYNSSTSSVLTQTVNKANTTVTLASSANPSNYGSSVTFTATVSPSAATGTVTFKNGSTTLGTGALSSGKATFSTSTLAGGSHSITASYAGATNYNSSTSSTLTQTVNKASTTVTLSSSANPSTYGSSVKFTATVAPSTATGTVTFMDGSATLGTGALSSGKATFSTSTLTSGSHSITASYGGDTNDNSSTSSALTQTVSKASPTVTLASSSNPSAYGSSVTFTATLSISTATGTVTFKNGSTTLGTGTISSGQATYSTSGLAVGSDSITASYGGDSNDNSRTSATLTQVVAQGSFVALTFSANPSVYGTAVTFTATVTPSAATGTVTFYDGSTALGTATINSGIATYATSALATGSNSITAAYGGNSTYSGSTSSAMTQSVLTVTSISVTPSTISLPIGATRQFTATGTYSNGTQGNITLSATWSSSATNAVTISSGGVATGISEGPATIEATVGTVAGSASVTGTPSMFRLTGSLISLRLFHTETLLQNGQVLITGGTGNYGANLLGTCELYNPTTGTFSATGKLNVPRESHIATLLANGMVLITGGDSGGSGNLTQTAISELYNPATGTFAETGSLNTARDGHTATLLTDGSVLIAGGTGLSGYATTAEIYNSTAGTFTNTGTLNNPRFGHSATLLNDGTVLIAGGGTYAGNIAVAELYNATTRTFADTGSLNTPTSSGQIATLLNSGQVFIAGGFTGDYTGALARTELYNPTTKQFTLSGNMSTPRGLFAASLLGSGNVLLVGGTDNNNDTLASADLYNPTAGTFSIAGDLNDARTYPTAALLNNGAVLIVGGADANGYDLGSAETYQGSAPPPPFSLQITPAVVNMLVGGTQQFTAVDNVGIPRTDATWTISNTSIATVTTNANGTGFVTALAAGQVTLTASAESVTAQEQVTILSQGSFPTGTAIWSAPPLAGFSVIQLAQAVPSVGGPDLYSISLSSDGTQSTIQALQADGEQLWQTTMPTILNNAVPDGSGGLIVTTCALGSPLAVMDLNATGQPLCQVRSAEVSGLGYVCYPPQTAVRGDGLVYVTEPTNAGLPSVTTAYPSGYISSFQFLPSTVNNTNIPCCVGPPIVNTDGTMYVEYEVRTTSNNVITSDMLYLYSSATGPYTLLSSTTQNEALLPGPIIPDGQGGILATWTVSAPVVLPYPYQAADVTNGVVGAPYNLPFSPQSVTPFQSPTLVLGENGTAFASGSTTTIVNGVLTSVDQIASFNLSSGATNWNYLAAPQLTLSIIEATSGNGLVAKTTDQSGSDMALIFNSSGTQTPSGLSGVSSLDYYSEGWWLSLTGGTPSAIFGGLVQPAMSSYFRIKGRNAQGSTAPVIANFETVDPTSVQGSAALFKIRFDGTPIKINNVNVPIGLLTKATFTIYGAATDSNLVGQIFKPIDAVAFIGHSLEGANNGPAIGLCFGQEGITLYENHVLPVYPCDSILSGGYNFPNPSPPAVPVEFIEVSLAPPSLASQAKIIFFAACDLNENMQTFMGITNSTVGRALLFPPSLTDVNLDMGEFEWEQIVANLVSGQNLQQAKDNANATTATKTWYDLQGNIVPAQAWQVIGDSGNGGAGIRF